MKRKPWRILLVVMALAGIALSVQPLAAHGGGNSFDDHYLAAACPEVTSIGRIGHQTVSTEFGVGVEHRNRVTGPIVFYCNIEADDYLNWLQFYAEDNSPGASVTVNLYQQDVEFGALRSSCTHCPRPTSRAFSAPRSSSTTLSNRSSTPSCTTWS